MLTRQFDRESMFDKIEENTKDFPAEADIDREVISYCLEHGNVSTFY